MLDFRVYTFLAVCEFMNFTKAAEKLHITQPAVTQHIQYLEKKYQVKLFIHDGKKLSLSPAGKILLNAAVALKNDERRIQDQLRHSSTEYIPFHFGLTRTIGDFVLPKPLARFQKQHPDINMKIQISNTQNLLASLQNGDLNFALIEGYFESQNYSSIVFSTEPFIPVCAAGHIFQKTPRCLLDLLEEPLIIREKGSGTRSILTRALEMHNLQLSDFSHAIEIGSMHTILDFLLEDCGISFLYKIAVQKELESGKLMEIPLSDFQMQHNFSFIWNNGSIYSSQYEAICKELQDCCNASLA